MKICYNNSMIYKKGTPIHVKGSLLYNHYLHKHNLETRYPIIKEGDKIKTIRFGEKGAKTAGKPKAGESDRMKAKRRSFKARHAKNIAKGKMSAAYWADKVKW